MRFIHERKKNLPLKESEKVKAKHDHKMREKLKEKQIDKMIEDSFPASDAPSTY